MITPQYQIMPSTPDVELDSHTNSDVNFQALNREIVRIKHI